MTTLSRNLAALIMVRKRNLIHLLCQEGITNLTQSPGIVEMHYKKKKLEKGPKNLKQPVRLRKSRRKDTPLLTIGSL